MSLKLNQNVWNLMNQRNLLLLAMLLGLNSFESHAMDATRESNQAGVLSVEELLASITPKRGTDEVSCLSQTDVKGGGGEALTAISSSSRVSISPEVEVVLRDLPEDLINFFLSLPRNLPALLGATDRCTLVPEFVFDAGRTVTSVMVGMDSGRYSSNIGVKFLEACILDDQVVSSVRVLCYFHLRMRNEVAANALSVADAIRRQALEMI